jgi:dTDP-4-amino-4,6-dideoxygalactose transaminase
MDYSILDKFERVLSEYTGAPHVVLTDSCTHAIELCLRFKKWTGPIILPNQTYISVPMTVHKLGLELYWDEWASEWQYEYRIAPTNIWDSARAFDENMFVSGRMQCLSFGWDKRLNIGHGGAILLDNKSDHGVLKQMAYDGRQLWSKTPWDQQKHWQLGFHYNMRLEDAQRGLELMLNPTDNLPNLKSQLKTYPDCSKIKIDL